MLMHLSSSSTKAETGGLLGVSGQPTLQSEASSLKTWESAQLIKCLPWYPEPHETRSVDACLWFQHSRGGAGSEIQDRSQRQSESKAIPGYTGHPVSRKKKGRRDERKFQIDMKREGRSER